MRISTQSGTLAAVASDRSDQRKLFSNWVKIRMSMQTRQETTDQLLVVENTGDRRSKTRIYDPFPATVHGVDVTGTAFQGKTILDNISTGGLYLRLMQRLERRTKLYIIVQLSNRPIDGDPGLRLHLSGEVVRVEPRLGGACGFAISIKHNRLV
jgi:PilZ domain-containing protein